MSGSREKAAALIDIALATYRDEIQPALAKEKRYTGAMIANALGIAQRRLERPDPQAALIDRFGAATLEELAAAIREGKISEGSHPTLARDLLDHIRAELAITNPRLLARREGAGSDG